MVELAWQLPRLSALVCSFCENLWEKEIGRSEPGVTLTAKVVIMSKTQMALKQQVRLVNAEKHSLVNVMVTQSVSATGKSWRQGQCQGT